MPSSSLECPRCGKRYPLPAQLAPGKPLRLRCPACGQRFQATLSSALPEGQPESRPPTASPVAAPSPEDEKQRLRRARRLARALVQEMLSGQRERRDRALAEGRLLVEFGQEIRHAWQLYQEKAGRDLARETSYFRDALNEILADGKQLF